MGLSVIGFSLGVLGEILLGISVYLVHSRVIRERKIDKKVLKEMKRERSLALIAIALIIIGYLMQLPAKLPGGFA